MIKKNKIKLEDLYIQLCEKANCKIFDFGPFVVEFTEGSLKSNVLSKPSLIKAVESINQNLEEEENYGKNNY